jgi:putative transposase
MARKKQIRGYPPEFRRKIVDLARAGRGVLDLSDEFGVGHQTIRNWLRQDDLDAGFLFLAVVLDVFSRRIVGWAMASHMRAELVVDPLNMALHRRNPKVVVHHSDHGSQYTSFAFTKRCEQFGVTMSMGTVGDCYDNAMCESFNAILECELLVFHRFKNQREASLSVFDFIESFYNLRRRHTAIGSISPAEFERRYMENAA